jgi:hypothetical protein
MAEARATGPAECHDKTNPEQRREKARLRSERWRRAHGIGPRKAALRPWLALAYIGALAATLSRLQEEDFSRAEAFAPQPQAELAEAARLQAQRQATGEVWRHSKDHNAGLFASNTEARRLAKGPVPAA